MQDQKLIPKYRLPTSIERSMLNLDRHERVISSFGYVFSDKSKSEYIVEVIRTAATQPRVSRALQWYKQRFWVIEWIPSKRKMSQLIDCNLKNWTEVSA